MKQLLENESYCLGMSLTIEALKNCPSQVNSIYLSSKAIKNKEFQLLIDLANNSNIEIFYDDFVIEKYSLKDNCYCIGFFNKYSKPLTTNKHIVCFGFKDIGQLGTIFRSAVSFNFKDIVLIDTDIDPFDPRIVRASMGSIFHLSISSYIRIKDYLNDYNHNLYCFNTTNSKELHELKPIIPYAILLSEKQDSLNEMFKDGYYIKHNGNDIPLSGLSSIVFNYCYELENN